LVEAVVRARRRRAVGRMADAAIRYAVMGWPVCIGAFSPLPAQRSAERRRACSCDRIGCPAPGAHPVSPAWQSMASSDPELIANWWQATPAANVILVTGRVFDVLDARADVGMTALARMERSGLRSGPVAISGDRAHFFIASRGAPADENEWWSCHLDCEPEEVADVAGLRWHCRSSYVVAPPSRPGTEAPARWVRDPASYELPDGLRLLEMLSDVCEESR
jgi:hypothetical protein